MNYLGNLLASAASSRPDGIAVDDGRELTYTSLASMVAERAGPLQAATVGARDRVGLVPCGTADDLISILAILSVGASVVPVAPQSRASEHDRLVTLGARALVRPGAGEDWVTSVAGRPAAAAPDEAYVLSTSGSSAAPKDVSISHANLVALGERGLAKTAAVPSDRVALVYSPTFDPWFLTVVTAMRAAATLVIPRGREALLVSNFVKDRRVTYWRSVPSHARMARSLGGLEPNSMPELRVSILGGELLDHATFHAWRKAAPACVVVNSYGPTETTVAALQRVYYPEDVPSRSREGIPLGRPLGGIEYRLVPVGEEDDTLELCLRGDQRFGGYVDSRHNAGRFLSDDHEFGSQADLDNETVSPADWYRTGDAVEVHDGELYFVSRLNDEVKVRGQRVDLMETARVLTDDPRVTDAYVTVVDDRVVAAVAGQEGEGAPIDQTSLRPYAQASRVTWLPQLPMLENGKRDIRILQAICGGTQV